MSESFVDLSYRGLSLGKRIKLTQVRPGSGYLEMPTPMPVGTTIGISAEDGMTLEAVVAELHEQVGGSDKAPGMLVRPKLDAKEADAWWKARASGEDIKPIKPPPPPDEAGKVTVQSARMTGQTAVPELVDDGRDTGVMEVPPDASIDTMVADVPLEGMPAGSTNVGMAVAPASADEVSRTTAMDAVDLAALGLSTSSSQMPAVKPEDYVDDDPEKPGNSDQPNPGGGGGKKKRRKRR